MHDPGRHPIHDLSDELVERVCQQSPILATFAGVRGFDDRWDDLGPGGNAARAATTREFSARLEALPVPSSPVDVLAVRVLREYLDERLEFHASPEPLYDLNSIASSFQLIPMAFDAMDTTSPEGIAHVAARLDALPDACATYRELLAEGLRTGHVVAARQVRAAIEQGRVQAGDASYYQKLAARCAQAAATSPALATRLERGGQRAHEAVRQLTDWLERDYLPGAAQEDGVGRDRYARNVRRHLGVNLDLDETYRWGWDEVRAIEAAMRDLASTLAPGRSVRETVELLNEDPGQNFAIPEPFLDRMLACQQRAIAQLDGRHFDLPDELRRIEIKLAPEGSKPGAYYMPPSEDFSRPGTVWYSPGTRTHMPLWSEVTTAYHEGFPGHHLQCGWQVLRADRLTRFQRLLASWPGSSEGWALYAEQLMLELGFFDDAAAILGMYAAQLARAYRVVVDLGLHLDLPIPADAPVFAGERWTFDRAVAVMRDHAFMDAELAESEVVRYLGWPAQAISYKVGQRVMLQLRAERRRREGDSFDLKRFHRDVLDLGSVGLGTLRASVLEG